ncbi:YCF48-related protein [Salegentibacter chungangensis]|uniref:YCF48-related protein n=1 Tax=Salegentibacter chungangensis TaxID=1335724 RepID=A0ABW3NT28_9FLAO
MDLNKKLLLTLIFSLSLVVLSCSKQENDDGQQVIEKEKEVIETAKFSTSTASEIKANSVIIESEISENGGAEVTERGVCWSTETSPTISNDKTEDGTGTGSFTSKLENLNSNTTYYARAYAKNSAGVSYGNEIQFKTLEETSSSYGIILRTTDGGETWSSIRVNNILNLHSVYFLNETTGYAVGDLGKIIKTTDGGESWSLQNTGSYILFDVFFANENTGYAVGNHHTILKTEDGGATWVRQESGTYKALNSVYFTDENTGVIVGESGVILTTQNGGKEWNLQKDPYKKNLYSVKFTSRTKGYAACLDKIYLTSDGGATWESIFYHPSIFYDLFAFSDGPIYAVQAEAVGGPGSIYKTANSGSEWEEIAPNLSYRLKTVFFINENTGYVAGFDGDIFKTTDGGNNWTKQESGTQYAIESIRFINESTGIAVGHMK